MTNGARRELLEWGKALVIAVILALAIRGLLLQPYRVEGTSMVPTLQNGERLFLNRLIYRLHPPQRGDVVVVPLPDEGISIVKRVIGLPGETVEIKDGSVWIDGDRLGEDYLAGQTLGSYGPVQVPDGKVFVLGDNRQASRDSRYSSVGFIEYARVKGKAMLVYWPLSALRTIPH